MGKYLVIFTDEINEVELHGFKAMTDKEVDSFENLIYSIKWPFTYQLSNLTLEYINGDDYLTKLEFKEISNEEYKAINRTFSEGFGIFIDNEYLENNVVDDEDDDDFLEDEEELDYDEDKFDDDDY